MVTSRTYNQLEEGTYGQQVPVIPTTRAIVHGQEGRIIGLYHEPSLQHGFRTNVGLVNASPAPISVTLGFFNSSGVRLGEVTTPLLTYEYKQFDEAFKQVTEFAVDGGYVTVVTSTVGGSFIAFASVVDNVTGDPVFVPAQILE